MQVAMVVRDMDAAMKRHWEVLKIGPWDLHNSMPARFRSGVGSLRPFSFFIGTRSLGLHV